MFNSKYSTSILYRFIEGKKNFQGAEMDPPPWFGAIILLTLSFIENLISYFSPCLRQNFDCVFCNKLV